MPARLSSRAASACSARRCQTPIGRSSLAVYNRRMNRQSKPIDKIFTLIVGAAIHCILGPPAASFGQGSRLVKVLLESQQLANQNEERLQGSGSVIIRRGSVQPSGRVTANERQTTVQRSNGIFTLVRDGGESILSVTTRVPQQQVVFYRDWATGLGYLGREIMFQDVGTSLKVSATVLPDNQVHLRLTPRISYFANERAGIIDLTEAQTELIVTNGQPVSFGGATTKMHEVTRQILGFSNRTAGSESSLVVTATIQ